LNCAFKWIQWIDGLYPILYKVTFDKLDTCHCQHVLASSVLIPSHANRVQHMQISEILLIRNCMPVKSLHQFFYYHSTWRAWNVEKLVWVHLNAQISVEYNQLPYHNSKFEVDCVTSVEESLIHALPLFNFLLNLYFNTVCGCKSQIFLFY
jgi:hypothetical protein